MNIEYGLIVTKVDEKGGTIGCYGPVYTDNVEIMNEIIRELIVNNKDDKNRYVPEIHVLGGNK